MVANLTSGYQTLSKYTVLLENIKMSIFNQSSLR